MCVLVEGHCISDTVELQEMIATPAAKLPYDHHHLTRLHAVETKAFRITGISHDEAESLGLLLSHCRQVGDLTVFSRLLSGLTFLALSAICPPHISAG